jgi:hypothetical protein
VELTAPSIAARPLMVSGMGLNPVLCAATDRQMACLGLVAHSSTCHVKNLVFHVLLDVLLVHVSARTHKCERRADVQQATTGVVRVVNGEVLGSEEVQVRSGLSWYPSGSLRKSAHIMCHLWHHVPGAAPFRIAQLGTAGARGAGGRLRWRLGRLCARTLLVPPGPQEKRTRFRV